jgi:DNA-binding NarL/FixJ family response regulator
MVKASEHEAVLEEIKAVRAQAIEHARQARRLSARRRELMQSLLDDGLSRADIARELGVSRQAIQKMMAVG